MNTKKLFIISTSCVLALPITMLIGEFHPVIAIFITTKLLMINLFWVEIVTFITLKLPAWAIVLLTRPIAMVKRHGTKVIAMNIGSKLVMKKVGPRAKIVIEKSIKHFATRKDNLQTKLVFLVIKWSVFKYKPPCESPSKIKKFLQNTVIKIIAMTICFLLVIIAIIFLGETQIIKLIKNIIEYVLEIDYVQKTVLKKAGNTWFERLSDKLYNIRFIGGFLNIILIVFLKLLSWIPIIGRYAEIEVSNDNNNNNELLERFQIQTKYEKGIIMNRGIRRHHTERLKKNRKNYGTVAIWCDGVTPEEREEKLSFATRTPCPCSCYMCGNPRKHFKEIPIREKRQPDIKDFVERDKN